jgi:putative phosphoesterase
MKILLLSDTHCKGPLTDRRLIKLISEHDFVIHAGDIASQAALTDFEAFGNFFAVAGNSDPWDIKQQLGTKRIIELGGVLIGICHGDHGYTRPHENAKRIFGNTVGVVVFGHSHMPFVENTEDVVYINPGSFFHPRGGSARSCAQLIIEGTKISTSHIKLE